MQFNNIADFINMGGYAFYVWLSYGVSAALIIYLIIVSFRKQKKVLEQIALRVIREQKLRQAAEKQMEKQGISAPKVNEQAIDVAVKHATEDNT